MSLLRIVARIAARRALLGKTEAGANILDSEMGALEKAGGSRPYISVYTDAAKVTGGFSTRALVGNGETDVIFEIAYSSNHLATDDQSDASTVFPDIPGTDDNFEFFLDLVGRQIADALNDAVDPWADLFRSCYHDIKGADRQTHFGAMSGLRIAMHHLTLTVDMLPDPARGGTLYADHPLVKFFVLVEELDDIPTKAKAARMLAAISSENVSALDIAIQRYGLTHAEAKAMLLTVPAGVPSDALISDVVTLADAELRHDLTGLS